MIDPFVILAPALLLAVVALLRFVGCNWVYGLEPTKLGKPPKITISPETIDADALGMPFELTVNLVEGDDFDSGSVVFWGGSQKTPKPASTATQLFVDITLDDIAAIGPVNVIATNSAGKSDPQIFTVNAGMPQDVGFDPQPPLIGGFVNGMYKNLDFEPGKWIWSFQPAGSVISVDAPAPGIASFSFANGKRVLAFVAVYPIAVGTVTVSDDSGNPPINRSFTPAQVMNPSLFVPITDPSWTKFSKTITVKFNGAQALPVVEISYFGPL